MKLTKIRGNSYFINAPTNVGVYVFKNKTCLLIDTGISKSVAKKIDEILIKNGLTPKYIISTDSHLNNFGGNSYFTSHYSDCIVYASEREKLYMNNSFIFPVLIFPFNHSKQVTTIDKHLKVNFILNYGINKLSNKKFEVISLPGQHSEHIGIITPEKVCYVGDLIFSDITLNQGSFPSLINVKDCIRSLNTIKEIYVEYFVTSSSKSPLNKQDIILLANKNIENINKYCHKILELLNKPLTKDDIFKNLTIKNDLPMDFNQFHLNLSCISSLISYLYDSMQLEYSIEDGKLYYFKKAQ